MPTGASLAQPRRLSRFAAAATLSVACAAAFSSPSPAASARFSRASRPAITFGQLPQLTADAMDKTTVVLPGQLAGAQNLLLLSWARDQAGQIESWTAVSQALEDMHPSARVYTALVSPPENILFRWWDNASLRASQTDPELLHWTLALYTDKTVLRRSLEIADEHEVVALLVDRAGHVLWKAQGSSTPASRAALLAVANHVGS